MGYLPIILRIIFILICVACAGLLMTWQSITPETKAYAFSLVEQMPSYFMICWLAVFGAFMASVIGVATKSVVQSARKGHSAARGVIPVKIQNPNRMKGNYHAAE